MCLPDSPIPDGLETTQRGQPIVNGVTAWRMHGLAQCALDRRSHTIAWSGESGGTASSNFWDAGIRVIGTTSPSKLAALRALSAESL